MHAPILPELEFRFREAKSLADGALAQVPDAQWFRTLDSGSNSIATIVRHLSGNLHSRWRDFLTTDGEKPDRHRDLEFQDPAPEDLGAEAAVAAQVAALRARWQSAWALLFETLGSLREEDLTHVVTIRGEPHTVLRAALRQLSHASYHAGQIVLLAKHLAGPDWRTLSVPKGGSDAHNTAMFRKFGGPDA